MQGSALVLAAGDFEGEAVMGYVDWGWRGLLVGCSVDEDE